MSGYDRSPPGKVSPSDLQGPRNVTQIQVWILFQMCGKIICGPFDRCFRPRGEYEQMCGSLGCFRRYRRSLLNHDMRIRTPNAKSADSGPTRHFIRFPLRQPCVNSERTLLQIEILVWSLEMERRRENAVPNNVGGIDKPCDAGSDVQMANVGLCRADNTGSSPRLGLVKRLGEGFQFYWIA